MVVVVVVVVRKSVLVLLLNRQCTGELSNPSVAVFLQSRRARYGLLEDSVAFLRRDLAVFTAFWSAGDMFEAVLLRKIGKC